MAPEPDRGATLFGSESQFLVRRGGPLSGLVPASRGRANLADQASRAPIDKDADIYNVSGYPHTTGCVSLGYRGFRCHDQYPGRDAVGDLVIISVARKCSVTLMNHDPCTKIGWARRRRFTVGSRVIMNSGESL